MGYLIFILGIVLMISGICKDFPQLILTGLGVAIIGPILLSIIKSIRRSLFFNVNSEIIEELIKCKSIKEYYTSKDVIVNSNIQPYKYICKYFDMPESSQLYNEIESKLNNFDSQKCIVLYNSLVKKYGHSIVTAYLGPLYSYLPCYRFFNDNIWNIEYETEEFLQGFLNYLKERNDYIKNSHDQRKLMTPQLREQVLIRDNYTCQLCGNSRENEPNLLLEVDHIVPIAKGGLTEIDNLQTLCWKCNRSKSAKV